MIEFENIIFFLFWIGLTVILPFWLIGFASRGLSTWIGSLAAAKVLARPADAPHARLDPESQVVIHITESAVSCHRPDGIVETAKPSAAM